MPKLALTKIDDEDFDENGVYRIPEYISKLSFLFWNVSLSSKSPTSEKKRIIEIPYEVELIDGYAFRDQTRTSEVEVCITGKVKNLRKHSFYGVDKLTIPAFVKPYQKITPFIGQIARPLVLKVASTNETYKLITANYEQVFVVLEETVMKDGVLYECFSFECLFDPTGSFVQPNYYCYVVDRKNRLVVHHAVIVEHTLSDLKKTLSAFGLS